MFKRSFVGLFLFLTVGFDVSCHAESTGEAIMLYTSAMTQIVSGVDFIGIVPFDDGLTLGIDKGFGAEIAESEVTLMVKNSRTTPFILKNVYPQGVFVNDEYKITNKGCTAKLSPGQQCVYTFKGSKISKDKVNSEVHVKVYYKDSSKSLAEARARPWPAFFSDREAIDFSESNLLNIRSVIPENVKVIDLLACDGLVEKGMSQEVIGQQNWISLENNVKGDLHADAGFELSIPDGQFADKICTIMLRYVVGYTEKIEFVYLINSNYLGKDDEEDLPYQGAGEGDDNYNDYDYDDGSSNDRFLIWWSTGAVAVVVPTIIYVLRGYGPYYMVRNRANSRIWRKRGWWSAGGRDEIVAVKNVPYFWQMVAGWFK